MFKTVPALYRDCLRTIRHMAADSSKARTIRAVVRQQFDANKGVREREQIDELKANAIRGLANYLSMHSISQLQHVDGKSSERDPNPEWLSEEEVEEMKRQLAEQEGVEWDDRVIGGFTEVEDAVVLEDDDSERGGAHSHAPHSSSSSSSSSSSPR